MSAAPRGDSRLALAGLLLLVGGIGTLALHAAGAPGALLDFLYDSLLSGLDLPPEPSPIAHDIVSYASLAGGVAELLAGALLSWTARPAGSPAGRWGGRNRRSRSPRSSPLRPSRR